MNSETPAVTDDPVAPQAAVTPTSYSERARKFIHGQAGRFSHSEFPSGQLAELRRLDTTHGPTRLPATLWRIIAVELEPKGLITDDPESLREWMAILQGLATMSGLHDPKIPLGTAIHSAKITELRLTRLLNAEGQALYHQVRTLAHQLRSKGQAANWADVAELVLSSNRSHADAVRRRIAGAFYRQEFRPNKDQA